MKEPNLDLLQGLEWKTIIEEDRKRLSMKVEMNDIWEAVKGLGRGKSTGPDGYIAEFFIHNWDSMKDKMKREIESIFNSYRMPAGWNDTKLVLIPKKDKAKKLKEFRLIAVCNVIYKIVAKILANRMSVLDKVISKEQVAFVPKRYIQENILVVSEMVNSFYSKASNPNILLKLDLEKAYDRTKWRAVYKILNLMSFPEELIRWIKCCIEEISFSCYFNGEISRRFKSFRGIRQGDPLSPYLFIIMEEAISVMTRDYCSKKRMTPYHIKDTTISHQLFADDIVFAIKGNDKSCKGLKKILENYCAAIGQKINREKSEIFFPTKCQPDRKHRICSYFDMKEGSLPMQYLGSLINPRRLNSSHQNRLCEKVNKKVDFWAKQLLSQAGKSTLLNSVVSSIPVYSLSTSWVSEGVVKKISKASRDFFWGADNNKKSARLISWSRVTASKAVGGLGLRDIVGMKKAMLIKRVFSVLNEDKRLWVDIYKSMEIGTLGWKKGSGWARGLLNLFTSA
ncbi:hypothetical protein Cni_G05065 [Canna indica]|uniref:Reverse transcriptase domain-containing protein n=1 Tax=Canna indica TaxID=4628 RepID=A0AAQ3JVV7_9LILI|nr:hypothetical protein Cni_G05065 [Canna indica]